MKILYIAHNHPPKGAITENVGGMQRVSMQLFDELTKRDDVEMIPLIQHASAKWMDFKSVFFLLGMLVRLPVLAKIHKPDVILFSSMATALVTYYVRKFIHVPIVTINHGHDVKNPVDYYQNRIATLFERIDGVISVSKATREECIKRGMDPAKGVALPNGFDMSDFKEVPGREEAFKSLEKRFNTDFKGKHILLTVGRQVKRKGHEWFIKEVLPKIESEVVYLVIGEGPEFENIKAITSQLSYKDKVLLVGKQPDDILKNAYSAADLFIMPNIPVSGDMEGFGIVLLEANLAGTPAVASDLEGIKDVVENGQNGYKIPVYDSEKFADKIDEVIKNEIQTLGKRSRSYVEDNFAWSNVADRYVSFLKEVIERYKKS